MGVIRYISLALIIGLATTNLPNFADVRAEPWTIAATVNGVDLAEIQLGVYRQMIATYDVDQNGMLSLEEASNMPTKFGMRQLANGRMLPATGPIPCVADLDANEQLSAKELQAFYQSVNGCHLLYGRSPSNARLTAALLAALQFREGDLVDRDSVQAAFQRLESKDANNDRLIGPGELLPGEKYPGTHATLVANDIGCLEGVCRLDISLHDTSIELSVGDIESQPVWVKSKSAWVRIHSQIVDHGERLQRIEKLAASYDEMATALDGKERFETSLPNHVELLRFRRLTDANGDQQVSETEWRNWQRIARLSLESQCVISIVDFERNLFTLLDQNHDGSLSKAEREVAFEVLTASGGIQDRAIVMDHIPRQIRIVVSNGAPNRLLDTERSIVPPWFRAMDRNGDGLVSRQEFKGPVEAFTKFDRDVNDMLDAREAATVE